jgi:hypothetical protein
MVNLVQRVVCMIAVLELEQSVVDVPATRGKDPGSDIQTPGMLCLSRER